MGKKIGKDDDGIEDYVKKNYNTLTKAMKDGQTCIVKTRRVKDGSDVILVCAINAPDEDDQIELIPFAEMIQGNPFELYEKPTPD